MAITAIGPAIAVTRAVGRNTSEYLLIMLNFPEKKLLLLVVTYTGTQTRGGLYGVEYET